MYSHTSKPQNSHTLSFWLILAVIGPELTRAEGPARFAITSDPPRSTIFINGKFAGATPVSLKSLPDGKYLITAEKHGFQRLRKVFSRTKANASIHLKLIPDARAKLTVDSKPSGARVYLDGTYLGATNLETQTSPGGHQLRLEKSGFVARSRQVTLQKGKQNHASFTLTSEVESHALAQIRQSPEQVVNYTDLAHWYVLKQRYDEAFEIFAQATDACMLPGASMKEVWRLYQEIDKVYKGQFEFADEQTVESLQPRIEAMLRQAIERHPENKWSYRRLCDILSQGNRHVEAAALYKKGAKSARTERGRRLLEIEAAGAYLKHGQMLESQGDFDEAIGVYEELLKNHPRPYHTWSALPRVAQMHRRTKDFEMAAVTLRRFAELYPENDQAPVVLLQIGDIYRNNLNNYPGAIQTYREFLQKVPDNDRCPEIQILVAKLYRDSLGKPGKASNAYENFLKQYPFDDRCSVALKALHELYTSLNKKGGARKTLRRLHNHYPHSLESADLDSNRGRILARAEAKKEYQAALKMARAAPEKAVGKLRALIRKHRKTSTAREAQLYLVQIYRDFLKQPDKAIAARRQFIKLFHDDRCPAQQLAIAKFYQDKNMARETEREYQKFLKDYPEDDRCANVLYSLASMFHYGQNFSRERVIKYNRMLIKKYPDRDANSDAQLAIARSFLYSQMFPEARKEYWKVLKEYPWTHEAWRADRRLDELNAVP